MSARARPRQDPDNLFDAVPPHDIEAEHSVLGAILLDARTLQVVEPLLTAEMFYVEGHRALFQLQLEMVQTGVPVDIVSIAHQLRSKQQLELIGGVPGLLQILETVPHTAHAEYYALIVRELYLRRRAIELAIELWRQAQDLGMDLRDALKPAFLGLKHVGVKLKRGRDMQQGVSP